jgi:2-deoxy-D-gluconate 3-dehydrogenase
MVGRGARRHQVNPFDLSGQVAVVTGARRGIGPAIAVALARAGAGIVGIGPTSMAETARLVETTGQRFHEIAADLGEAGLAGSLVQRAIAHAGRIDILVNNAGIIKRTDALDVTEGDWADVMAVNLRAPFFLAQAVARHLVEHGKPGRIINIASLLSFQGGVRVPAYAASKHGIAGVTRALANELGVHGITVNAIAPGYVVTDNTAELRADERRADSILSRIPLGRWGQPDDIAGTAVFLASAAAAYINGAIIPVDGGWLGR